MRKPTIGVLIATALIWIGYDIWAYIEPTQGDTLSEVIQTGILRWSAIPFGLGALLGHWLWPATTERKTPMLFLGLGALITLFAGLFMAGNTPLHPTIMGLIGFFAGRALWPLYPVPKKETSEDISSQAAR